VTRAVRRRPQDLSRWTRARRLQNETGDATNITRLDYVILDPRESVLTGTAGADTLIARIDDSQMSGLDGNDTLTGMDGDDVLKGGNGVDILAGGLGRDTLIGGADSDTFDFNLATESTKKLPDVIKDFLRGEDHIDLSGIDAIIGGADDPFTFIGKKHFHHTAGELHYVKDHGNVFVEGDTDGNGKADFRIEVQHLHKLGIGDFVL